MIFDHLSLVTFPNIFSSTVLCNGTEETASTSSSGFWTEPCVNIVLALLLVIYTDPDPQTEYISLGSVFASMVVLTISMVTQSVLEQAQNTVPRNDMQEGIKKRAGGRTSADLKKSTRQTTTVRFKKKLKQGTV